MKYHNITKADMLNGEGLRVVLWVSGCSHKCPSCHNSLTWDENDGIDFTEETKKELYKELDQDWCDGITLSGGDPLFLKNRAAIKDLVVDIKKLYPNKTIWSYTGYTFEELKKQIHTDENLLEILENIDVLLDGRFVINLAREKAKYVGSSNQRIIDVKKSLENRKVILYVPNKEEEVEPVTS
ncbi:MAG: anaerobic ribonucleoside-triphosphate reductase activating protein [Bacilli bacterium]|nr:anaerobic ribonucleoside-triphosphate reductase activating protein [Bacilli bacterium]